MARAVELLLYSLLHFLSGVGGLRWEEGLENGAHLIRCRGQEAVFPWRYALEDGETLVGISWSYRATQQDKLTTLASYGRQIFDTTNDRIYQVETSGIRVSDIQPADSGIYVVNVRLSGGDLSSRNASLLVAEPPVTKKGRLEVMVNEVPASVTTQSQLGAVNGDDSDRLMCGNFIHRGTPPASVVWEDPDGQLLPSSSYDNGYFILELSKESKGGTYHCLLNRSSPAVSCLASDAALNDKVLVGVLKRPAPSAAASMSAGVVAAIVIVVVIIVAVVVIVLVVVVLRSRKGKSYAPKEPDSPGPDEEAAQPFKAV